MVREEKSKMIDELADKFSQFNIFYITDTSLLSVGEVNKFRKLCFEKGVEYRVVKNTLIAKALIKSQSADFTDFNAQVLKGSSGILFSTTGNLPAKLLTEFKSANNNDKVVFKGASIDSSFYIGAENLAALVTLKSKEELVADIIALLQSPSKNVISALQSGGGKLAGILKTLSERNS